MLPQKQLNALPRGAGVCGNRAEAAQPKESACNATIPSVAKSYTASDGKLVLRLTPADEGGFVVTSPLEPELVTEAETIEDAFRMAHDALRALRASRAKLLRKLASSSHRSA
jgi:antitoxin HicB